MSGLRRGFKAEATRLADEIRQELGLSPFDPLNPSVLAEYLEVPITPLSDIRHLATGASHFLNDAQEVFSAATVFDGPRRAILHNDSHAAPRQNSNLAHELSHALLMHPATPAIDDLGCRYWDQQIEGEADWLAGVMLVPDVAAISIARGRWGTVVEAAQHFGVSTKMVNYRLNVTGAYRRAFARVS